MQRHAIARLAPLVTTALLFFGLAYLIAAGQPNIDLHVFRSTLVQQGIYAALGCGYVAVLVAKRRLPGPTRLDAPIAALVIVYAASTLLSVYPRVSLEASLLVGAVLVAFYAFHDFDFMSTQDAIRGFVAAGSGIALLALYNVGADYLDWLALVDVAGPETGLNRLLPPSLPRISGVGDHVNVLAMVFNLALPFALALMLSPARRLDRVFGGAAAIVLLSGLLFTVSRGAWLATFAALPVFFLLYFARNRDLSFIRDRLSERRALVFALAGTAVVVIVLGIFVLMRWESRPEWLFRASLSPRYDAAAAGFNIFLDRPLLGAGPYTYSLLYNEYSAEYPVENIHPHNGYLTALVDIGVVGAVVLAAGGLVLAATLWQAYRIADARRRVLVAAGVASLASIAVHALLDSPNAWSTALLPLAVVLAICLRLAPPTLRRVLSPATLPRLAPLLVLVAIAAGWAFSDRAHANYANSLQLISDGDFDEGVRQAQDAARADPSNAAYQLHAGVSWAIQGLLARDVTGDLRYVYQFQAVLYLERAIEAEPRSAIAYANLALALRLRAEATEAGSSADRLAAAEAARNATRRAPTDMAVSAVAGTVLEWAGAYEEAAVAYSRALSHDAGLVQSPFWAENEFRASVRQFALDASTLTACEKGRVTAIYRGYPDDLDTLERACRDLVERDPGDARARSDLAMILYALGRRDEARREAEDAVARIPDTPYARTALAVCLIPGGDLARVRQELVLGAYLGDPDAALLLTYTYETPAAGNPVMQNLGLPSESRAATDVVIERLKAALPNAAPMVFDNGLQRYLLGVLYYRMRFFRESPASIFIPSDWIGFASPRALLILEALRGR